MIDVDAMTRRWTAAHHGEARVPCFVKQMGANAIDSDYGLEPLNLRHPKGGDWLDWREDLRVREWPRNGP